eukprot:3321729-Prymnesium_polylepis.1
MATGRPGAPGPPVSVNRNFGNGARRPDVRLGSWAAVTMRSPVRLRSWTRGSQRRQGCLPTIISITGCEDTGLVRGRGTTSDT